MAVPFAACMALVASLYHLPPRVLPSIMRVEGGRPGLARLNTDGTRDLGLMQVNTRWLPALARYTRLSEPDVERSLLTRSCFNIAAGGLILRTYLDEARGEMMQAIGYYHSHTKPLGDAYQEQVIAAARSLFTGPGAPVVQQGFHPTLMSRAAASEQLR